MTTDEKLDLILSQQAEILDLLRPKPKEKKERPAVRFEEWWKAYPKKINKRGCLEKWRARKLDSLADIIIADTKARKMHDARWLQNIIPNSTTYLNQSRWESEIETRTGPKSRLESVSDAIFGAGDDGLDLGQADGQVWPIVDQSNRRAKDQCINESGVVGQALPLSGPGYQSGHRGMDGVFSPDSTRSDREIEAEEGYVQDSLPLAETKGR